MGAFFNCNCHEVITLSLSPSESAVSIRLLVLGRANNDINIPIAAKPV